MTWVPEGTVLGDLEITETFVDFDGPRVFACRSATDQRYIAGWAAEGPEFDTWLYLPVSRGRLAMVRSGGLPLRRAFEQPEGLIYVVYMPHLEGPDSARPIHRDELDESWLPDADFSLSLETPTLPAMDSGDDFARRARQESRSRLRLKVDLPKYTRSEAPTKKVGEILISTQSLYDNIGLVLLEADPPQAGRLPAYVAQETATDVVGLSAASFVIEIASGNLDDLLGESVFGDITARVLTLLSPEIDRDDLLGGLSQLRPRGAKSFRNFVRVLASTGGGVTVAGAGTRLPYASRQWTAERLESLSKMLNTLVPEDIFELRGRMRLYRADMDRKQFGVIDELTDTRYEGRIADRALYQVDHATVNETYAVVLSEFNTFDEAVGERRPVYVLEQLSGSDSDAEIEPVQITRISESGIFPEG